eukprot:gene21665-28682_t
MTVLPSGDSIAVHSGNDTVEIRNDGRLGDLESLTSPCIRSCRAFHCVEPQVRSRPGASAAGLDHEVRLDEAPEMRIIEKLQLGTELGSWVAECCVAAEIRLGGVHHFLWRTGGLPLVTPVHLNPCSTIATPLLLSVLEDPKAPLETRATR